MINTPGYPSGAARKLKKKSFFRFIIGNKLPIDQKQVQWQVVESDMKEFSDNLLNKNSITSNKTRIPSGTSELWRIN